MIGEVFLVKGLKYNLLRSSQLCEKSNSVTCHSFSWRVIKSKSNETLFIRFISGNTYTTNLKKISSNDVCLISNKNKHWLWHMRISYNHIDQ